MPAVLAAATPKQTVAYGSFPIDETKGCIVTSEYDKEDTDELGAFYCEFAVRLLAPTGVEADDDAAFAALVAAVEAALELPRQKLLVKVGAATVKNWDFTSATQTAFLIKPELTLLRQNARDFKYGFRVTCQFPGKVPGNFWRRDSVTKIGLSLRERRTCTISATWTSSPNVTAYAQYQAHGDTFFDAYKPSNSTDQHGTSGTWVEAEGDDGPRNDENSLITVTRVYWEVFHGRRESTVLSISTIGDRRVVRIPSFWAASSGNTALQNYIDNDGNYATSLLASGNLAPVSNGYWVHVDTEFGYNDQNGTLTAFDVYEEVVNGLRSHQVTVTTNAAGMKTLVVAGIYYETASPAKTNYTNNVQDLIDAILTAESVVVFEHKSTPKIERYDQTGRRFEFVWRINELAHPQGSSADNDNVTIEFLELKLNRPFGPQSITAGVPVTRLQRGLAVFRATIDANSSGGKNVVDLWDGGLRAHVLSKLVSKLGSGVSAVEVVDEDVAGLLTSDNELEGVLNVVVKGGSVLWVKLKQRLTQLPARDFVPRADGTPFSVYPSRDAPEKLLQREGWVKYVVGTTPPVLFDAGDNTVGGYDLIDTGCTAQESIDNQAADGTFSFTADGWEVDRASGGITEENEPSVEGDGDGFPTNTHHRIENWAWFSAIEPGTEIP